ncbi:MAG TPA: hypothetical protein PLN69_12200 [bacterium]|nr:hypothetical protein [bacterium]
MVSEINKDVTAKGGLFAVVMIPYVLGDRKYSSEPFDVYPPQYCGNAFVDCMSRNEIPFLNLHEAFDDASLDVNDKNTVFLFDRHFNAGGHEKAAELLFAFERNC